MKKINSKSLLTNLVISLGTGLLAASLTRGGIATYMEFEQPPLSPPAIVFPIVWTILYILMAVSAYLVYESTADKEIKDQALSIYIYQLFFNFLWPIVFFNFQNYLLAFGVLLILWILIIQMIKVFYQINPLAAKLQIPYLIWVTFAGYLNLGVYFLNK